MSKRFADTELYDKDWFVALTPNQKLFWHYVTSKCDTAGIWDINKVTACRVIGIEDIDLSKFVEACNIDGKERVFLFANNRKMFITTTIDFQCGSLLNPKIFAHKGVIDKVYSYEETAEWFTNELNKGNIGIISSQRYPNTTLTQPQHYPNTTLKEKEKDIDILNNNIDNNIDNNIKEDNNNSIDEIIRENNVITIKEEYSFDEFWNDYEKKVGDKAKLMKKWKNLSNKDKRRIKEYLPGYKKAQPDKQYRKNPETFLNNKSWNDEIVSASTQKKGVSLSDMQDIHDSFTNKNLLNGCY